MTEGWYKLRQHAHNPATTKIVKTVSDKSAKIDDKYFRLLDMLLDREDTPLQADISSVSCAQAILFGVCGISVNNNGSVTVAPPKNRPVKAFKVENVNLCGFNFSVFANEDSFEVVQICKDSEQRLNGIIGKDKIVLKK